MYTWVRIVWICAFIFRVHVLYVWARMLNVLYALNQASTVCVCMCMYVCVCMCMYWYVSVCIWCISTRMYAQCTCPKSLHVCACMCMYYMYRVYVHVCCMYCMHQPRQALMPSQQARNIPVGGGNPQAPLRTPLGSSPATLSRDQGPTPRPVLAHLCALHASAWAKAAPLCSPWALHAQWALDKNEERQKHIMLFRLWCTRILTLYIICSYSVDKVQYILHNTLCINIIHNGCT